MTITNGYCTLAELRRHALQASIYTAATLSFTAATKTIADSAQGLARFQTGTRLQITGSTSNNGFYTVATGGVAASLVVAETLVNEIAGASVTLSDVTDVIDDNDMELAISTASRDIDAFCRRRFYTTSVDEVRHYSTAFDDLLFITGPDVISVTSLKTDDDADGTYETTWSAGDFSLLPTDATMETPPGFYRRIGRKPNGAYWFPRTENGIEVTGKFGYTTTPDAVHTACLIQAFRLFRRKQSPDGVIGMTDAYAVRIKLGMDPDAERLLAPYVKEV